MIDSVLRQAKKLFYNIPRDEYIYIVFSLFHCIFEAS